MVVTRLLGPPLSEAPVLRLSWWLRGGYVVVTRLLGPPLSEAPVETVHYIRAPLRQRGEEIRAVGARRVYAVRVVSQRGDVCLAVLEVRNAPS